VKLYVVLGENAAGSGCKYSRLPLSLGSVCVIDWIWMGDKHKIGNLCHWYPLNVPLTPVTVRSCVAGHLRHDVDQVSRDRLKRSLPYKGAPSRSGGLFAFEAYFSRGLGVEWRGGEAAMAGSLFERDLRSLMALVEEGRRDDSSQALPWSVLEGLRRLIPCDSVVFKELDVPCERVPIYQSIESGERLLELDGEGRADDAFWALRLGFLPCSYPERTGDLTSVTLWSDFYTHIELRNAPMFAELYRPEGRKYSMLISLPNLPGQTRRIQFWRDSGPDFGDRERLLLQLIRPHLYEIYLDAQRQRDGIPQLSRREVQVLQLAAQGRSNVDIAQQLFISVGTVRKHMEHIFDRTGVRSRALAAALVMPHLSVTDPR
jgi:DNA-binding CsgD family transcriptional regulator